MNVMRSLLIGLLVLMSGCASAPPAAPTVNVTGTWVGTWESTNRPLGGQVQMVLEQKDADVTGRINLVTPARNVIGPVGGSVSGDEYRLTVPSGMISGYLTVKDDAMTGIVNSATPLRFNLMRTK
ncbi:MAG TPA: hypothetical protein VGV06_20265 [Methylomirabilota bacterium]|nr:hypothetical protein [Methylomirabilota bacterium]